MRRNRQTYSLEVAIGDDIFENRLLYENFGECDKFWSLCLELSGLGLGLFDDVSVSKFLQVLALVSKIAALTTSLLASVMVVQQVSLGFLG